jgi:hypothetical protein
LEQSIKIKFDYIITKGSLQFYKHQDISKIEEVHIPNTVSELRYKSDLTDIEPFNLIESRIKGELFSSI